MILKLSASLWNRASAPRCAADLHELMQGAHVAHNLCALTLLPLSWEPARRSSRGRRHPHRSLNGAALNGQDMALAGASMHGGLDAGTDDETMPDLAVG